MNPQFTTIETQNSQQTNILNTYKASLQNIQIPLANARNQSRILETNIKNLVNSIQTYLDSRHVVHTSDTDTNLNN